MTYLDESRQIPYLGKSEITQKAEGLLDECWDGIFPINIEMICDYLDISIIPIEGLAKTFQVDAFVSSDFRIIYVEQQEFEKESNRYRFSLAHELGHYVLHREYFSSRVEDFEEWRGFSRGITNDYVERQANYFAGSLLAPESALVRVMNSEFDGSFARNVFSRSHGEFRYILRNVQSFFMVSEQVMARRMSDVFLGVDGFEEIAKVI